jgi:hypothetical protein
MNLPNVFGVLFGIGLIAYGFFGRGNGYNEVESPLRGDEPPPRPFTRWGRLTFIGFGAFMVLIGLLGEFNS